MATEFNDATADHKWSTAGNWSSGKPDSADAITIDAGVTSLIIDEAASCLSFDATGTAGITISGTGTITCYGNFTLDANVTINTWYGSLRFSTNACIFDPAGRNITGVASISAQAGADLSFDDDVNLGSGHGLFVLNAGSSLTTNDHTITCGLFYDQAAVGAITLNLGTSTINCTNVSFGSATITKSTATETINCTIIADTTFNFNTVTWGTVTITAEPTGADTHTINGAATFTVLNL